jgi:hypothetical protein
MKTKNKKIKTLVPSYLNETGLWYVLTPKGEWEIFKTLSAAENFCENETKN